MSGFATNATLAPNSPGYAWVDEGLVIQATGAENRNAIDLSPSLFYPSLFYPSLFYPSLSTHASPSLRGLLT